MGIIAERARRDIEFLSRAGLDLESFITESVGALDRVVPSIGSCLGTLDPATGMITGTYKYGALADDHDHDAEWCFLEYGEPDDTSYQRLGQRGVDAVGMHLETGGKLETSPRLAKLLVPVYGVTDELRVVFRERYAIWGGLCLFRAADAPTFDAGDVAYAASLSSLIARGIRTGILVRIAHQDWGSHAGPSVLIISADGELRMTSPGTMQRLAEMSHGHLSDHLKVIFDKAGVHSRRELIAKVYVDQYAPRAGGPLGTSGAFADLT